MYFAKTGAHEGSITAQRTKLCRSELPANDVMRGFSASRPSSLAFLFYAIATLSLNHLKDSSCPQIVAMLAVQVVEQVINEAQTVVQAIHSSGEPLIYASLSKKIRNGERFGKDISEFTASVSKDNVTDHVGKEIVIATSTPQKKLHRDYKVNNDEVYESIVNGTGGGDERLLSVNLTEYASSFLDEVSDLTEVKQVGTYAYYNESLVYDRESSVSEHQNGESTSEIVGSFLNRGLNAAMGENSNVFESEVVEELENISSQNSNYSTYSLLLDIENLEENKNGLSITNEIEIVDDSNKFCVTSNEAAMSDHNEENGFTLYEKTFLTLNCDEHNSEDGGQLLDDVTSVSLQDVELLTVCVSQETVKCPKEEKKEISSSVPSKLGFCASSPGGGRFASSLLQDRSPTPSPARRCARKFNTLNEATLFPQRWRKYNLDEVTAVFQNNQ
ncbi:hypothetical protein EVAR_20088_1 [Eumeta japonica]|uniref:Uncharacterized protein n=1 Tax=Eumeta variegata TaxID=151549 RepID=A0A4C1UJC1_EUMVA|nr:hypothetical protein EVAR_20088_1 [Eumeta japonica]